MLFDILNLFFIYFFSVVDYMHNKSFMIVPAISFVLVVSHLNPAIKDFFLDSFIIFVIATLVFYDSNKNIVLSMAEGFLTAVFVKLITMQDASKKIQETYEKFSILFSTTDSKVSCNVMTKSKLLAMYGNDEARLRNEMYTNGIPMNVDINDDNAPKIGTYLEIC